MREEENAAQKALGGKGRIVRVGMGARHIENLRVVLKSNPKQLVLLTGVCGALNPKLRCGDAVTAFEIVNDVSELSALPLDGVWAGRVICSDQVVQTAREKAALYERSRADVVEMESMAVAQACLEAGAPFHFLKIVSDEACEDLPDLSTAFLPDGMLTRALELLSEKLKAIEIK